MEGESTEENGEHRHPHEILNEGRQQRFLSKAVADDSQADISSSGEDDEQTEKDC